MANKQFIISLVVVVGCFGFQFVKGLPKRSAVFLRGSNASIADFPYQLSVEYYDDFFCGASVLNENWAITAGHCVDGLSTFGLAVRSGSSLRKEGGILHPAGDRASHVHYDFFGLDYDIGIIKVEPPFSLGSLTSILPLTRTAPSDGTQAVLTGWGSGSDDPTFFTSYLRADSVAVAPRSLCAIKYKKLGRVTRRMLCVGVESSISIGSEAVCSSDPGAPLVANGELIGVVSWATGCIAPEKPGVFTNVAEVEPWVTEYVATYSFAK